MVDIADMSLNLKVKCSSKDSSVGSHNGHCRETGSFQAYFILLGYLFYREPRQLDLNAYRYNVPAYSKCLQIILNSISILWLRSACLRLCSEKIAGSFSD